LPWPAGIELQSARWDNRALDTNTGADGQLVVRIDDPVPGMAHRLQFQWRSPTRGFAAAIGELWGTRWNQAESIQIAALHPRPGYFTVHRQRAGARAELLQRRAVALLGLHEAASASRAASSGIAASIEREVQATLAALPSAGREPSNDLLEQWQARRASSASASEPGPSGHPGMLPSDMLATAMGDPETLLFEPGNDGRGIAVHEVRTAPALATLGIAGLLALVVLARFQPTWRRLASRQPFDAPAANLLLLGVLWCVWLKAPLIGLGLVAAGVWRHWQASHRPPPADEPSALGAG
jgi:hypothetical protein